MKRVGIITALGKMELKNVTEDVLNIYLNDDRYISIGFNDYYYIFVDRDVDTDSDLYAISIAQLNQELLTLNQIDKDKNKKIGRPRIILDTNIENILNDYFQCKLGASEAKQLIGITQKNNSTWQRLQKEYKDKHNIIDFRNNVDNFKSNPKIDENEERVIGYIKLKDNAKYRFYTSGKVEEYNPI